MIRSQDSLCDPNDDASKFYKIRTNDQVLPLAEINSKQGKFELRFMRIPENLSRTKPETNSFSIRSSNRSEIKEYNHKSIPTNITAQYLPQATLVKIFSYLPKTSIVACSSVCRNWQEAIRKCEKFWRIIDLSHKHINELAFFSILSNKCKVLSCQFTTIISTGSTTTTNTTTTDDDVDNISSSQDSENERSDDAVAVTDNDETYSLELVDLSHMFISHQNLNILLKRSCKLKNISLEGLNLSHVNILALSRCRETLRTFNVAMAENYSIQHIVEVCNDSISLEELNLSWSSVCQDKNSLQFLLTNYSSKSLMKLNIAGCRGLLTDSDVQVICQSFPNLTELDISDCTEISGTTLREICNKLSNLEKLSISRCYKIMTTNQPDLTSLAKLKSLQCFGMFRNQTLETLKTIMPGVEINLEPFSKIARSNLLCNMDSKKYHHLWNVEMLSNVYY